MNKFFLVILGLVIIIGAGLYYSFEVKKIEREIFQNKTQEIQAMFAQEVQRHHGNTAALTYLIAQDKSIIEALLSGDGSLIDFSEDIAMVGPYVGCYTLWIQVIDKKGYSLYRSWSDNVGDHAASARLDVVQMMQDPKPMKTISVGRFDMNFRTMLPVVHEGEYIGMVEMITKFNSIARVFMSNEIKPLFVAHHKYTDNFINPFSNLFIGQNYVANPGVNRQLLEQVEQFGLQKFLQIDGYMVFDNYLVVLEKIEDVHGEDMGYFLFFVPQSSLDRSMLGIFINNFLTTVILILLVVIFVGLYLINRQYVKKLSAEIDNKTKKLQELNESLHQEVQAQVEQISKQDKMLQEQAKLATMGEMMSAVAHQWRQPLNAVSINIQNLEEDFEDGLIDAEFLEDFVQKQTQMIGQMSKTIDQFRNFFEVDKRKTNFSVKSLVMDVEDLIGEQLRNHKIAFNISTQDFKIMGCRSNMQQVLLNLVNNAKDAILQNNIKNAYIDIDIYPDEKKIVVRDNAGGVDEAIINRIFEPYFTTKEQGKGTGIGLYVSRIFVVEQMGAKMRAYNCDKGLCMEIKFNTIKGIE